MSTPEQLIDRAFKKLAEQPGFVSRPDQVQLALLLSDLIGQGSSGAFEAPTGLGKSLATLIPAIAQALVNKKRTVIATYTNVLAEQYWRRDLPLALELFEGVEGINELKTQFLIGRQRYLCKSAFRVIAPDLAEEFEDSSDLGIETEFRQLVRRPARELTQLWRESAAPPVCPGRLCSLYHSCYYYKARRLAEKAEIVITNHSVVIQDGILVRASEDGKGLLGAFDFLVLDEAHDFPQAALSGLEFELSSGKLSALAGIIKRLEEALRGAAMQNRALPQWTQTCSNFRAALDTCNAEIVEYSISVGRPGILAAEPSEIWNHPVVKQHRSDDSVGAAKQVAEKAATLAEAFVRTVVAYQSEWTAGVETAETVRSYLSYIQSFAGGCRHLFAPEGCAVSFVSKTGPEAILRQDPVDLSAPLTEMIWSRVPYACLSATLAVDGAFEHFSRTTGATPEYQEVLPTPFDYGSQAALYLPPAGAIPDPTVARKEGTEEEYFRAVARELSRIIRIMDGRTLALFHSRREMDGVRAHMHVPPDLPILVQAWGGTGSLGEKFRRDLKSSLFALRSFWTGFDAPGETLSCVVLVRVPFEVPIEPTPIARMAWLQTQGIDPFQAHTLPNAKMMMRQGAGRLIRKATDQGIIALLDPRLKSKRYGEEILANLPPEMREFSDFEEAAAWVGLSTALV
jgi:ATP-dependent DNA helicase DinG